MFRSVISLIHQCLHHSLIVGNYPIVVNWLIGANYPQREKRDFLQRQELKTIVSLPRQLGVYVNYLGRVQIYDTVNVPRLLSKQTCISGGVGGCLSKWAYLKVLQEENVRWSGRVRRGGLGQSWVLEVSHGQPSLTSVVGVSKGGNKVGGLDNILVKIPDLAEPPKTLQKGPRMSIFGSKSGGSDIVLRPPTHPFLLFSFPYLHTEGQID